MTVESAVDDATARRFWVLYQRSFGELAAKAAARQLLHEHEFMEEMLDERVDKLLARDENGEPVGMCTVTCHLETVPWISPAYFAHHYPEQTARNAVYYLGFVLVDREYRRGHVFIDLISWVTNMLIENRALCAYDICSHNNDVLGLAPAIEALVKRKAAFDVRPIDTQTYYSAAYLGPREVSEMRTLVKG